MVVFLFALSKLAGAGPWGIIMGKVIDIDTGEPLVAANILLSKTGLGTVTDLAGRYVITGIPPGKYELVASRVGYGKETQLIEVIPDQKVIVDFKLKESPILMDEIIATATKTTHLRDDLPIPSMVVSKEEINKYNALDAGEAIRNLTGIEFNKSFAPMAGDGLRIQGLPSGYTLILLDGERVSGRYPLTQIPANVVERIEVVKGPSSVLYGSDAIGGVCNVITRSLPNKPFLNATLSYGSYSAKTLALTHGASAGKFGYLISAYGNRTKGKEKRRSWYNAENIFAKFGWESDLQNSLIFRGGYYHEDLSLRKGKRFDLGADGKIGLPNLSKLRLKVYRAEYHDETNIGGSLIATVTDEEKNRGEIQWSGKMLKRHLLTLGAEGLLERIEGGDLPDAKTQYMGSPYFQDELHFHPLTLLVAGRLDAHSIWGLNFNPKVALLYKFSDRLLLRASVGDAFKAPTFKDLYRRTWHGHGGWGFWIEGNPDLRPESSTGYELELETQLKVNLYGKITLFRHDLKDMIQGYWAVPDSVYSYRNIGSALIRGVETEIKTKIFIEGLIGAVRYTFLKTEDKETKKELTYTPRHRINGELSYFNKKLGLNLTLIEEYVGKRFEDQDNEKELPSYFLTHLKISQLLFKKVALFLTINNLFGKEYEDKYSGEDRAIYKVGLNLRL